MSGDALEVPGVVVEALRGGTFTVDVALGGATRRVLAKLCGRMAKFRIRVLAGDCVTVEVSPYDLSRGRITERERLEPRTPGDPARRRNN